MRTYLKNTVLAISMFFVINAESQSTDIAKFKKSFKAFVSSKMKKHEVVGASVAVIIDDEIVVNEGFGFSDKALGTKADKHTTYPIGSVSKIVTSTAVLKLYSDGLIDIDKPFLEYVPDFEMKSHFKTQPNFTVRHLLAHYGGLPRLRAKGFLKKEYEPVDSILSYSKNEYLIGPAGKSYQYSDWGVDLLSLLVQRVSGTTYENYVKTKIFEPLKMEYSYFGNNLDSKGYLKGKEVKTYEFSHSGSDGVVSNPLDLSKLCSVYFDSSHERENKFLKSEIIADALTPQFEQAPLAYDKKIGLMWDIRPLRGFKRAKKAGIHEPFYTYVFFIPEYNSSVVVCSNSNSSSKLHWDSWSKAFDFISKKLKFDKSQSPIKKRQNAKKLRLSNQQMSKLQGVYNTDIGMLQLSPNGEKFDVELMSEGLKGIGIPYEDKLVKLYVKKMGLKVNVMDLFWNEVDDEIVVGEQFNSGNRIIGGVKIKSTNIPDAWKKAIGTYKVIDYGENEYKVIERIELSLNKVGVLQINISVAYPSKMKFKLGISPISNEAAIIPGYNFEFFAGETIELLDVEGIQKVKFSGYTLSKQG